MFTKNFFSFFLCAIVFIAAITIKTVAQSPCPNYNDLLDRGWAHTPGQDPHEPNDSNRDEFAATDPEPFMLKVNDYPPVKSFPIIPYSGCSGSTFYYFSFDTDDDHLPINYKVVRNEECSVKTYKIDENGGYLSGWQMIVVPPDIQQVGSPPDFAMKYDGTRHDAAWDEYTYSWDNVVYYISGYTPQSLTVNINGADQLNYNSTSEFVADINGGSGYYRIKWFVRSYPNGNWGDPVKDSWPLNTYYNIPPPIGGVYYFYDDEYKYNLMMPDYSIEIKVEISDEELYIIASDTKVVTVNPEAVTFINHIETSENYGELILNENHSDPISSGDSRSLIFGNNYMIRTNELPFLVDWNSTGKTEKHINWTFNNPAIPPVNLLNYNFTLQASTERIMKSTFQSTEPAAIKTLVDGAELSGLNLKFNDPWFYYKDANNNWYQSNMFKTYTSPLEMYNNLPTSYGGIFLNQEVSPDHPYYSVQSPLTQTVNLGGALGTRTFYFQNWSTSGGASLQQVGSNPPGYDQKAIVFTSAASTINANLKGQLMSNDQNAISSNSQRKIVRTDNGIYHIVYESLGQIWYTHSLTTNFHDTWSQDYNIISGENGQAKNPSIDYEGNKIKIVFEIYAPFIYPDAAIFLVTWEPNTNGIYYQSDWEDVLYYSSSYFGNAKPVIDYNNMIVFLAYRKNTAGGIYQMTKWYVAGNWQWGSEGIIPNTTSNSKNPTVAGKNGYIDIAYEHSNSIKYIHGYNQGTNWNYVNEAVVSGGCGYTQNYSPSILVMETDNIARLCWVGKRFVCQQDPVTSDCIGTFQYKVLFKGLNNLSRSWAFGGNNGNAVSSPNINKSNNPNEPYYAFAWYESSGENKFADNTLSTLRTLNTTGQRVQIVNGQDKDNMFAMSFNYSSSPYYFQLSDDLGSFYSMEKIQYNAFTSGREGVVLVDSAEFYFALGDIEIDGQPVDFVEITDTVPINNLTILNQYLISQPISVNDNSSFIYSVQYGINDSLSAVQALVDDRFINFKVQLLDANTGEVIGEYDDVTYNAENIYDYGNISYQVNTQGIGNRTVRLKLIIDNNFVSGYSLTKIYSDESALYKSGVQQINFSGNKKVTSYTLAQNYPNPFNPRTTIKYEIPEGGLVTLKVYDILGSEIVTLVNEEKSTGRYEVNFDASLLSSGVYIYRLNVNDYVSVKKMVLLK